MQLGFVIDHSRCIGCHACTVACKAENDVPVGSFRTWVKYTETGEFPAVRRSFAVLRCNQCTEAPCVTICPTRALQKRRDGIVDIDPEWCIGCKSCMQGCPYDAIYINDATGTAEKCHFCAHRTESGLAPACAVVCPTEAIIPGDLHDSKSRVSSLKAEGTLTARKPQAGTGPNVWYREVEPSGVDPLQTSSAGGFLWSDQWNGNRNAAQVHEAVEKKARARTVYDVPHKPVWGGRISAYLFLKSVAAGVILAPALIRIVWGQAGVFTLAELLTALVATLATMGLLVADLKRPERFWYMLVRPNMSSWVTRGAWVLGAYTALLLGWLLLVSLRMSLPLPARRILFLATTVAAALAACYTAWLFGQARGRPLWMKSGLAVHLLAQALVAGSAALILLTGPYAWGWGWPAALIVGLGLHATFLRTEHGAAPPRREEEYHRAANLMWRGPYRMRALWMACAGGVILPLVLALPTFLPFVPGSVYLLYAASVLALAGLAVYEDSFVRAGQALPIS